MWISSIGVERIAGNRHEIWDVQMDGERRWVVTNPMNLYPQSDFMSRDVVLVSLIKLCVTSSGSVARLIADNVFTLPTREHR